MTSHSETSYRITGMDCADCAKSIERGVRQLAGVEHCALSFTSERLTVTGSATEATVIKRIADLGYQAQRIGADAEPATVTPPLTFTAYLGQQRQHLITILGLILVVPGIIGHELLGQEWWWADALALLALIICWPPIARQAWRGLRFAREFNINALMSIAAIGAVIIGAYTEAGLVIVLFTLGEALEGFSAARARSAVRSLATQVPDVAIRIDQHGHHTSVATQTLVVGDRIVVHPGARIPCDGVVCDGLSEVSQAAITGESRLIVKRPGDDVYAGSINSTGALIVEMRTASNDSLMAHIVRLVEHAQAHKAPIERSVDHFARWYTPLVVLLAVLVAGVPPVFGLGVWWDVTTPTQGWIYRGLALLIVACPCALVLSTPVTIVSALSAAARSGLLIKGGHILERLASTAAVAFDKTGTLTSGTAQIIDVRAATCAISTTHDYRACTPCDQLVTLAAAVERHSEHPIAHAIVRSAPAAPVAQQVVAHVGQGVGGMLADARIFVGSHEYFDQRVAHHAHWCTWAQEMADLGHTPVMVSHNDAYQGTIVVSDTIRPSAAPAMRSLHQLGIHTVMLTGDHTATAQHVAARVEVATVYAELLPAHKLSHIDALKAHHGTTLMVGDGINDTPALARADVSMAMSGTMGGSTQAMEVADMVLLEPDLTRIPYIIALSRRTMQTVRFNIALSIAIKLCFLVIVIAGLGSMWLAVIADVGATLLVTLNGLRMMRSTPVAEVEASRGA